MILTMNRARWILFILVMAGGRATWPGIVAADAQGADDDLGAILDRTAARVSSYPELKNWKASVVSVQTEMDKNWKPKKVIRVLKAVRVRDMERNEDVLRAEETEKGVTKEVTAKYVRELAERQREAKKREDERKRDVRADEDRKQRRSFNLDDLIPFSEKNRAKYAFSRLEDEMLDGRPVFVLRSSAKVPSEALWEGQYFISQDNYDVLKVILRPAENPKFVKKFTADVQFQVLPTGYFVMRKSRVEVDAGMVLKHVRMLIEEDYSEFEVFDVPAARSLALPEALAKNNGMRMEMLLMEKRKNPASRCWASFVRQALQEA